MGVEQVSERLWRGFRAWPMWVQALGWLFFWWLLVLPLIWRSRLGTPLKSVASIAVIVMFALLVVSDGDTSGPAAASTSAVAIGPTAMPPSPMVPPTTTARMPKLKGIKAKKATSRVSELGVHVVLNVTQRSSAKPAGTVLHQSPAPGETITSGAVVHLIVAKPFPKIPGVIGKSLKKAEHILRTAGYKVKVVRRVSSRPVGTVIGESPSSGHRAKEGSTVTIAVAKAAPRPPSPPSNCTAGYSPCLPPASDYDCVGGSGNGPAYTTPGVVYRVTGSDPYGLDADNDGYGCE
jgi:hypothetical protein